MAEGGLYEIPNELLKSLDCPICKERFINPKIIDCTHVFCLECLQDYVAKDSRNFPPCPVCRTPINVPNKGVSAYQTQTFYADVIRCLETQSNGSFECRSCESTSFKNTSDRCQSCREFVCSGCSKEKKHRCNDDSRGGSNLTRRPSKCQSHCNEELEFYCIDCKIVICKQCKGTDHVNHETQSSRSAAISCKKSLLAVQESLDEYIGEIKDAATDLESFVSDFSNKVAFTKEQIETEFENIIRCINEKKKSLLKELQDIDTETKKRFETELEEIKTKDVRAKTLDELSNNLIKYGSDSEAIQFQTSISCNWKKLQEEALYRYGKGFRIDIQFQLKERVSEMVGGDIGVLSVFQYLSPWPRRKALGAMSLENKDFNQKSLELKIKDHSWQIFPIKRSKVFSDLVHSQYKLGAYKICSVTGRTVVAWTKSKPAEKSPSFAGRVSKQFGSRPISADKTSPMKAHYSSLEIAVFNDPSVEPRIMTMDNIPDITTVKLAVHEIGVIRVALYPGNAVVNESKARGSFKRLSTNDDCIYVASVKEIGNTLEEGELRKIDILTLAPECKNILFEITNQGYLIVHHPSYQTVFVYSPCGEKRTTKFASKGTDIVGIRESKNEGFLVVSAFRGIITCEEYGMDCALKYSFILQSSLNTSTVGPHTVYEDACYDMRGNILIHFKKDEADKLSLICAGGSREEILQKPEMLHKVDQMSILPQGRICLFDKAECVLMTLQYLQ